MKLRNIAVLLALATLVLAGCNFGKNKGLEDKGRDDSKQMIKKAGTDD